VSDRPAFAPGFTIEHVEAERQELDDTERPQPAPPPTVEPSSPHSGERQTTA
jgi:hypothetical protein